MARVPRYNSKGQFIDYVDENDLYKPQVVSSSTSSIAQPTSGVGATTSYGGGNAFLQQLINQSDASRREANEANKQRYLEAMGIQNEQIGDAQANYTRLMDMAKGLGTQEQLDARQRWESQGKSGMANLAARGLSGTTVAPTIQMGYQKGMDSELARLNESQRREQIGYDTSLQGAIAAAKGNKINLISSKVDEAQDYSNLIAQLAQGMGQSSGGGGMGGGYPSVTRMTVGGSSPSQGSVFGPSAAAPKLGFGTALRKDGSVAGTRMNPVAKSNEEDIKKKSAMSSQSTYSFLPNYKAINTWGSDYSMSGPSLSTGFRSSPDNAFAPASSGNQVFQGATNSNPGYPMPSGPGYPDVASPAYSNLAGSYPATSRAINTYGTGDPTLKVPKSRGAATGWYPPEVAGNQSSYYWLNSGLR